jgi:hypothetical protein
MATLHETLHDCSDYVQRHGGRRRACARCGRTWSVHKRRRGRKRRRVNRALPKMVFVSHEVAERLRQRRRCSRDAMYRQIRRACQDLVQRPPTVLVPDDTDLVLIVDGLWFAFRQREWVLYNMALRPIAGDRACFLDPILLEGKECAKRWRQALALSISRDRFRHIRAFVTDGFRGARTIATDNGWVLQRCHWHLLSALRGFVTGRKRRRAGEKDAGSVPNWSGKRCGRRTRCGHKRYATNSLA